VEGREKKKEGQTGTLQKENLLKPEINTKLFAGGVKESPQERDSNNKKKGGKKARDAIGARP